MTVSNNSQHGMIIEAFLTVSRSYLALGSPRRERPRALVALAKSSGNRLRSYRKAIQNLLLAAGVGAFVVGPVLADPGCDYMRGNGEHHVKAMEQHRSQLHEALKLSAEQEPAWQKLVDSEQPRMMGTWHRDDWSKLTAPERAEKMLEISADRQSRMTEHVAALKAFYAALTPVQQKVFEEFHTGRRGNLASKPGSKAMSGDKAAKPN